MSATTDNNKGGYLLFVPVLLVVGLWLFIGYCVAKAGASYRATRIVLYPAYIFMGNFFGTMMFVCLGWLIALIIGNKDMANYVVGNASELSLLSSLFGDPLTVPFWHIVVYQFFMWLFMMRPIADMFTPAIYEAARS